ncbi:MAG: fatty acid desaturase, partial [Spirochaetales bacterium]|nr:fatty acid desaturase [Spirochaetales bacterium]
MNLFGRAGRSFSSGGFLSTVLTYLRIALRLPSRSSAPSVEWLDALHKDQPQNARRSAWWCSITILFHASIIVVGFITGLWVLPILITLAAFIGNIGLSAVGLPQHCGLKDNNSDFRK